MATISTFLVTKLNVISRILLNRSGKIVGAILDNKFISSMSYRSSARSIQHLSENFSILKQQSPSFRFPINSVALPKLNQNVMMSPGVSYSSAQIRRFRAAAQKPSMPTFKTGMKYRRFSSFKELIGERFGFRRTKPVPPIPLDISMMKMQIVTDKGAYGKTQLQLYPVPMERQPRLTPMDGPPAREGSFRVEKPPIPSGQRITSGQGPLITIIDLCKNAKAKIVKRTQDIRSRSTKRPTFNEERYTKGLAKAEALEKRSEDSEKTLNSSPSMHWNISLEVLNEKNEPKAISVKGKPSALVQRSNSKLITKGKPIKINKNSTPTVEVVLRLDLQIPPEGRPSTELNEENSVSPAVALDDHLKSYKKHGCCKINAGKRPCPICYANDSYAMKKDDSQTSSSLAIIQPSGETESRPFGIVAGEKQGSNKLITQTSANDSKIITTTADGRYLHTKPNFKIGQTDLKGGLDRLYHTNAQHFPEQSADSAMKDYIFASITETSAAEGQLCSTCRENAGLEKDGTIDGKENLCSMCKLYNHSTEDCSTFYDVYRKMQTNVDNEGGKCPICNLKHRPHCKNIQYTSN